MFKSDGNVIHFSAPKGESGPATIHVFAPDALNHYISPSLSGFWMDIIKEA
jgi:hypothetical protein